MTLKKPPFRLVMGRNCVEELLAAAPERVVHLYISQGNIFDIPIDIRKEIPVKITSKQELSRLVDSESHQGIVAAVKERSVKSLKDFLTQERDKGLVVMLDSIFDPQNFGAILRACECLGADGVIYSKNRGVDITPVVSKASVGASELVDLYKVSNLATSLQQLQDAGFEAVAAEAKKGSVSLQSFNFSTKTVLVLGSEGKGIQPLISGKCDSHVMIPMLGRIDSLNVSQAAAVFLSAYRLNYK